MSARNEDKSFPLLNFGFHPYIQGSINLSEGSGNPVFMISDFILGLAFIECPFKIV